MWLPSKRPRTSRKRPGFSLVAAPSHSSCSSSSRKAAGAQRQATLQHRHVSAWPQVSDSAVAARLGVLWNAAAAPRHLSNRSRSVVHAVQLQRCHGHTPEAGRRVAGQCGALAHRVRLPALPRELVTLSIPSLSDVAVAGKQRLMVGKVATQSKKAWSSDLMNISPESNRCGSLMTILLSRAGALSSGQTMGAAASSLAQSQGASKNNVSTSRLLQISASSTSFSRLRLSSWRTLFVFRSSLWQVE